MEWVYIGIIAGSLVSSLHPNREACEGRNVVLTEMKVAGKCIQAPSNYFSSTSGTITLTPGYLK